MPPSPRPRRPWLAVIACVALAGPSRPAAAQPTQQAQQAAATGILAISATQPGAQVWIDNRLIGPAPINEALPAGQHTIRVAADGFDPFVRRIQVRAGTRASVAAPLSPGGGTAEFQVDAPGGRVTVDGGEEIPLPVRLNALPAGTHSYVLNAPGREPQEGSFEFRAGMNLFVYAELPSSRGRFRIESEPAGAAVWLDGEQVGETPLSLEGIEPGEHLVRVDDGKHPAVLELVDTSDGSSGVVDARLGKKGGAVTIKTGRDDAEVRMGGVALGAGKVVSLGEIARGRYTVEVVAPGQKPATGRINAPASGRAAYRADLVAEDARARSTLEEIPPFYRHWAFWTAVGVGAAGATTGAIAAAVGSQPVPIPEGDVIVTLP